MMVSVEQLQGYTIRGDDAEIGKLHDVYFDDVSWKVLFLLADTRPWLLGRLVLVVPSMLGDPDTENRVFPTSLTKAQVENGPSVEEHKPVSRQHAVDVAKYWDRPFFGPGDPRFDLGLTDTPPAQPASAPSDVAPDDPHLLSAADSRGHRVDTPDGRCGHIEDWLVDLDSWTIREVVIDTTDWWPGGNVRIPATDITGMSWDDKSVQVRLSKEAIEARRHTR
jgi:hypothetical protein